MGTLTILIDVPPSGELEAGGNGTSSPRIQVSAAGFSGDVQHWSAVPDSQTSTLLTSSPAAAASGGPPAAAASGGGPGTVRTWMISTAERAVFTFAASFFSALVLSGAFNITTGSAALFAGASTALSVVTAAVRSINPPTDNRSLDVVTRVGLTLLQTFAAAFMTSTAGATHFSDWRAGALAGAAAAFTTAKGLIAVQVNGATGAQRATPASLFPLHFGAAAKAGLVPA